MQKKPRHYLLETFVLLFVAAGVVELPAQTSSYGGVARIGATETPTKAELQEAYNTMRDQMRTTTNAIVNNRLETEASAREQAVAVAKKIDALSTSLADERRDREAEADRFNFVLEQQQSQIRQSNHLVVWVACAFGTLGSFAMLFAAFFQWRTINRIAEVGDQRAQLSASLNYAAAPTTAPARLPLALSTERLISAVERMEQRLENLEHSTAQPRPATSFFQAKTHDALV